MDVTLPSNPDVSGDRYATFPGTIGFAKNGVAIFNPLNGPGQNAVAGPNTVRNVPHHISTFPNVSQRKSHIYINVKQKKAKVSDMQAIEGHTEIDH